MIVFKYCEKTKELPVLYESDAKDSITVYLKNTGLDEKNISGDAGIEEEGGYELQPPGILSLFRECGWLLPREIGRNGEYVVNISSDCRRFMDFLRKMTEKTGEGMMSNRIFSMYEIVKSAFEEDSVRRETRNMWGISLLKKINVSKMKGKILDL